MAQAVVSDVNANYVEWGPILAGAIAASAISFVLLTAGTAVGLSLISPLPGQSYGRTAAALAAFWAVFVPIFSLLIGGYLAGRMRASWSSNPDEVQFRDGVHGLLVWAVAIVISGLLAYFAAATAAQVGTEVGRAAIADRGALVASSVDQLFRPPAQAGAPNVEPISADTREELTRIFVSSTADGNLDDGDRDYLAQVVANRTGLSPETARERVEETYASALQAVETARKAAVGAALATVSALLLGLAAAWYAAQRGGNHRDHNIPARFTFVRGQR